MMTVDIVKYEKDMDYEKIAKELGLEFDYVSKYFKNYVINHVMPIRSLDYQETMFVKAIKYVKELSHSELEEHYAAYDIDSDDLDKDPLILERYLSSFTDDYHYNLVKKYSLFILEPALLYNNMLSPLLDRLTLEQELIMLTNFAAGRGYNGTPVGVRDRLSAIQMLSDKPMLTSVMEDTSSKLTLEEIRSYLALSGKDEITTDSEKEFAKEMLKLKEKRDGAGDPLLVSDKDMKKLETLTKPRLKK